MICQPAACRPRTKSTKPDLLLTLTNALFCAIISKTLSLLFSYYLIVALFDMSDNLSLFSPLFQYLNSCFGL